MPVIKHYIYDVVQRREITIMKYWTTWRPINLQSLKRILCVHRYTNNLQQRKGSNRHNITHSFRFSNLLCTYYLQCLSLVLWYFPIWFDTFIIPYMVTNVSLVYTSTWTPINGMYKINTNNTNISNLQTAT